jgi:Cu-Zn family superoxide dismutase
MKRSIKMSLAAIGFAFSCTAAAMAITVPIHLVTTNGEGQDIGDIMISETPNGLLFTPNLHDLAPGLHGLHIHANPSCADSGMAAGSHLDPKNKHLGPNSESGHLGDLPVLTVANDGTAKLPMLAPRLKSLADISNRALIIHINGDNYSDEPEKLGGGGARLACGVIEGVTP